MVSTDLGRQHSSQPNATRPKFPPKNLINPKHADGSDNVSVRRLGLWRSATLVYDNLPELNVLLAVSCSPIGTEIGLSHVALPKWVLCPETKSEPAVYGQTPCHLWCCPDFSKNSRGSSILIIYSGRGLQRISECSFSRHQSPM